ncbi:MAG: hypothetical protein OXH15_09990 [Gammaproteobacteria bacterium]|nr:hypothetical protein [Gammaproteobacteria bacterium]
MTVRRRTGVRDGIGGTYPGVDRESDDRELDAARRMALEGLAGALEAADAGRDWFAMKAQLRRVEDAVQAVWYAARVRDDGR